MSETSGNASETMAFARVDPETLLDLIAEAVRALPTDPDGMISLKGNQYYYMLDINEAFMKELKLPPKVEDVGDLTDDVRFLELETKRGIDDPNYVLERVSHVLRYMGAYRDLVDNNE